MNDSTIVWHPSPPPSADCLDWVLFRRDLRIPAKVNSAEIRIFATHRYRLRVDGAIVAYGPIRYVPGTERHDCWDLSPRLAPGLHCLTVEACRIHGNNFQHMAEASGRFVAWGEVRTEDGGVHDLATPGDWRCRRTDAWAQDVPCYSFAIGPIEACDTRRLAEPWFVPDAGLDADWLTPAAVAPPGSFPIQERDVPRPTGQIVTPGLLFTADLIDDHDRFGFVSVHPTSRSVHVEPIQGQRYRYVTWLHSPREQEVTLTLHWGPHFLNGVELKPDDVPGRGNCQQVTAPLRGGWNLLCGEPGQTQPRTTALFGLPRDAGLTLRSTPSMNDPNRFRLLPARQIDDQATWWTTAPAERNDLPDADWDTVAIDAPLNLPAREMAWDQIDETTRLAGPTLPLRREAGHPFTAVFDFGIESLGHVWIDVDAPAGTVVDLGYDEGRRGDGALNWFGNNPFIESADRFRCRGGRQSLETFLPRGGRFLQVTIRPPRDAAGATTLHAVALRDAHCLPRIVHDLHSDDALEQWTLDLGKATLLASCEDAYCDSPWRERGAYLGDSYVQTHVEFLLTDDHRLSRRALHLFAAGQLDDGQLHCVVPAWYRQPHGDFTLIYAIWLHDYWRFTGDDDTLNLCLPAVDRLLASPTWKTSEHSILWDALDCNRLFIDWGCRRELRTFDENGVLNAFRIRALQCAAAMHERLGDTGVANHLQREADLVTTAYRDRLWLRHQGRFAGGTRGGEPIQQEILHGNILALAFDIADRIQQPMLVEFAVNRMKTNAAKAARGIPADDFAELYFHKFALDALARIDRHDVARQVVRDVMQILRAHDATTFWECIHRGVKGQGSLCHSWSCAPMLYVANDRRMRFPRRVGAHQARPQPRDGTP